MNTENNSNLTEEGAPPPPLADRNYRLACVLFLVGLFLGGLAMQTMQSALGGSPSAVASFLAGLLPFQVCGFALAIAGLWPLLSRYGWRVTLGVKPVSPGASHLWWCVKALCVLYPAVMVVNLISQKICTLLGIPLQLQAVELFGARHPGWPFWMLGLLTAVILAPVTEEILFRQVVFRTLRSMMPLWATGLSAMIFALAHGNAQYFAGLLVVGLFLQHARNTGGLGRSILLHALFNMISFCYIYYSVTFQTNGGA